jgi:hypothetical protein
MNVMASDKDYCVKTTWWLSTSNASSDETNGARKGNGAVLFAALAVLVAIALYLVVSREVSPDAVSLVRP